MDSNESVYSDQRSCVHLWAAVLKRSLDDLTLLIRFRNHPRRFKKDWYYRQSLRSIRRWFLSKSEDIGAFLWVCETVDMSHEVILSAIKDRLKIAMEILDE
jgi:hypothetical protein